MSILKELGFPKEVGSPDEELIYNIGRLYLYLEKELTGFFKAYGLTPAKFNVLLVIKHIGEANGITQNEISQKLFVSETGITRLIDKLEKDSLVKRFQKAGDRRVNLIKITKKGQDVIDKTWPKFLEKIKELTKGIPQKNKSTITAILSLWRNNLIAS
ncbi:MAG: MarR family transcriptional regulator [Candidatus Omnitrophica bacterium]|nr:MarR family transcriptional regulator [Candidatus Omnitrophota bacterium]